MDPALKKKKREYEAQKARTKELLALKTCTICGERSKLFCPCKTTAYCSVACQKVDWRERGHRKACKDIRAAEAARAEAPTPPPSPPKEIFYGPAPRSHADEVRARIAAEHEAARARREARPERAPDSERFGARCPICFEGWDVNCPGTTLLACCCRRICRSCFDQLAFQPCALCGAPWANSVKECLVRLRRHVENDVPEAVHKLGAAYLGGKFGLKKSGKKAARLFARAAAAGNVEAMVDLGRLYDMGNGNERPVRLDRTKALELFRKAADTGSTHGQYNLGLCLIDAPKFRDLKDEEKMKEAFRVMKLCADRGMFSGQILLARFYVYGWGVEKDLVEARRLCELAATRAPDLFEESIRDLREDIAAEM